MRNEVVRVIAWVFVFATAGAQSADYRIDRYTVDAGGGRSTQGVYTVEGTFGQPDADPLQPATAGTYSLSGGFWSPEMPPVQNAGPIFKDGFE